ncbi:MAG: hypothetical protein HGA78_02145 [Nitrospirales bacterium]|nr:hypothetical protein [Nitrospirales bacterium]
MRAMAIEALKRIFQISPLGNRRELTITPAEQQRRKPRQRQKREAKGKVDIKV